MKRAAAVRELRRLKPFLQRMGVTSLFLFGSTARDEASGSSDIDVFVDYNSNSGFSLISLSQIRHRMEVQLEAPVDITTRGSLRPSLRSRIEQAAIQVF